MDGSEKRELPWLKAIPAAHVNDVSGDDRRNPIRVRALIVQ